jgi:hypothetical protein
MVTAFLEKLEKDLLYYDMHHELLAVYSALKKINVFSESYFHYSQLFNKHIAYSLSLEKAEEILGTFTVALSQYDFSRSPKLLDNLVFLSHKINDYHVLNPSRQTGLVRQIALVQLEIFCNTRNNKETTEELLGSSRKLLQELPDSSPLKTWEPVLDYLCFEYYFRVGQKGLAVEFFRKVDGSFKTLFLYTNLCLTSRFLISKIKYLQQRHEVAAIRDIPPAQVITDPNDTHTNVLMGYYTAMIHYYDHNYKEAAVTFNSLLNMNSFKDYFHITVDIKLSLAFLYLLLKEYDMAANLLNNLSRKIKTDGMDEYQHANDLIKVFQTEMKGDSEKLRSKMKDSFELYKARNNNSRTRLLPHFNHELNNRYK